MTLFITTIAVLTGCASSESYKVSDAHLYKGDTEIGYFDTYEQDDIASSIDKSDFDSPIDAYLKVMYVSDYSVQHNLYIFGHSLDITDRDILRELLLNDKVYTTIFYVNKDVMGKQIANLVKIIGQDELIRRTGGSDKTIEFRQQQAMVCR